MQLLICPPHPSEHALPRLRPPLQLEGPGAGVQRLLQPQVVEPQPGGALGGVVGRRGRRVGELGGGLGLVQEVADLRHPDRGGGLPAAREGVRHGGQAVGLLQALTEGKEKKNQTCHAICQANIAEEHEQVLTSMTFFLASANSKKASLSTVRSSRQALQVSVR